MQREYPEQPLVGVGAIVIENSRVVLVKRAHPPLQNQWSIPGGVLEVGELVREAAVREAREENDRVQYHYVLVDFLCRRVSGELTAAGDAAAARWFTRDELSVLNLAEDTLEVVLKGLDRAAQRQSGWLSPA